MNRQQTKDELTQIASQWLLRLQSPELSEVEEQQFFFWLEASSEHQQAYIEAEAYWEGMAVLAATNAANAETPAFVEPQLEQPITIKPVARNWRWQPQAIAASIILLVGLIWLQLPERQPEQVYLTAASEQRQIRLSDGSQVTLNPGSQLRVDSMSADWRVVYLQSGEALFDVHPDSSRPFIVVTDQGAVRVLGTEFSVRTDSADMLVTVVEGKVAVADPSSVLLAGKAFSSHTTLVADQQLSIAQLLQGQPPHKVDARALTDWRDGKLVYNGVALAQVAKDLSRYFGGEIQISDSALAAREVVAVIDLVDKATALATLEAAFDIVAVSHSESLVELQQLKP
jgi:transmembrane sensor